jgi:hypothetical protein
MARDSRALAPGKLVARSAISNGSKLLPNVDGRSLVARRFRDICAAIVIDQGGDDNCSESRKQLIRRFAALAVQAEAMEAKLEHVPPHLNRGFRRIERWESLSALIRF